ncbi:hypothetical protein AAFN88_15505 [Pelagibius sp. CAU 1746]|uniref:hypothetical protein n=1 Tax=Pelagibius sp. CAU 1746 TaxID=3140370 RepID=UPI00325BD93A
MIRRKLSLSRGLVAQPLVCALAVALAAAPLPGEAQEHTPATECWRGWGYLLDGATGGYKSQEMLLVTIGAPVWDVGRPVELFLLDRASGLISEMPSFTILPENPRQYFRGRLNYMDTTAAIEGSQDRIVVGLSHIEPAKPGVPAKERYNRWACGFPEE